MLAFMRNQERPKVFFGRWAMFGMYLFLTAFFFASGTAPLRTVFYVFLVLPFLLGIFFGGWKPEQYGGWPTLSALVFVVYCALSTLWGRPADVDTYLKQAFFVAIWLVGISWLCYGRPLDMQRVYTWLIMVGTLGSLVTLSYFYIYQNNVISERLSGMGLLENPTIVAQTYGVVALLAYIKALQAPRWYISTVFFVAALLCFLPIVMSQTRGAALAFAVVSMMALVVIRPAWTVWLSQLLFASMVVVAVILFTDVEQTLQNRGISLSLRDVIWLEVLGRSIAHPVWGIGLEQDARILIAGFEPFHHAHNSWLDIVYYTGLVGGCLALWHLFLLLRCFNEHPWVLPVYLWLIYGCLCLLTNGAHLLTAPGAQWWMYWVPAGLLTALVKSGRYVR